MNTLLSPEQRQVASETLDTILGQQPGSEAVIQIAGAVGSGKTSLLQYVNKLAKETDIKPVFIRAQVEPVDTAATVLSELIDHLLDAEAIEPSELYRDPFVSWDQKFDLVQSAFEDQRDRLLLICDEPSRWFHLGSELSDLPDREARKLFHWVFQRVSCRRIIAGWIPEDFETPKHNFVPALEDGRELLSDTTVWSEAADIAMAVAKSSKKSMYYRSAMEIRLLAARYWLLQSLDEPKRIGMTFSVPDLVKVFLDKLEYACLECNQHQQFAMALTRLSILRTPANEAVFGELTTGLSGLEKEIIRNCLCEQWDDGVCLHPLVRYQVVRRERDSQRPQAQTVWRINRGQRQEAHGSVYNATKLVIDDDQLRPKIEELHHGLLSTQLTVTDSPQSIFFSHQLDEVGRTLSYVHRLHRQAAEVFRVSLKFNPDNGYAHHYLAFNLDWIAAEKEQVEFHYQRAIELEPNHPWRWSRWISYLVTIGQNEWSHKEWKRAEQSFSLNQETTPDWIYFSLHRWVARWMLHWSRLEFAEGILDAVPERLFADASFLRLRDFLVALQEAKAGRVVFPLFVPSSQWWSATGHAGLPNQIGDSPLRLWLPARIEYVEGGDSMYLSVGQRGRSKSERLWIEHREISRKEFSQANSSFAWDELAEGRFLELGFYGASSGIGAIAIHSNERFHDPDLIPLVPPANRWFNAALDETWGRQEDFN